MSNRPDNSVPLFATAKWIGAVLGPDDGLDHSHGHVGAKGAPWLRQSFQLAAVPPSAQLFISAPGWYELHINGKRVGNEVLAPVVTQFTARTAVQQLDVTKYLRKGRNAVAALLGNGWFNCQTNGWWQLDEATWRTNPPMLLELFTVAKGERPKLVLASNVGWKAHLSHITCNSLRNGEKQDLRMDIGDPSQPDFDDSQWGSAQPINPPMGQLEIQDCPPCIIDFKLEPKERIYVDGKETIYDFGQNLSGWCELEVEGAAGCSLSVIYSERRRPFGGLDREELISTQYGDFMVDRYILDGKPRRILHPHFTYHGFRYALVHIDAPPAGAPLPEVKAIRACFIHTDLKPRGLFSCSNTALQWLQDTNAYTYLCNHTGIPTDCPHREKNGWTGDASLALETGLWNFDVTASAAHFSRMLMDCQRPNGQLPCITPTGGWGYNWGCGPAWDTYAFEAAWQLWQFTGDASLIHEQYDGMAAYVDYLRWQERDSDGIVYYGLGDWCPYNSLTMPPAALTSTGYYCEMADRMAVFAKLMGYKDDIQKYKALGAHIRQGFVAKYMSKGDGSCGNNSLTALAAALYFKLAPKEQASKTLKLLLRQLKENGYAADFGILGAKYVLRVLGETGHINELLAIFTREECPSWGYWRVSGATTFWEQWTGQASQTHIMFGDPSACLFRYLGGIAPAEPGFTKIRLTPALDSGKTLPDFKCIYTTPYGEVLSQLVRDKNGRAIYLCRIPEGTTAELHLPKQKQAVLITNAEEHRFTL